MPRHQIVLKPSAIQDLDRLRKYEATMIADGMERLLAENPTRESKSRIKRLKGIRDPDFRLRLDEYRVFYNVRPSTRTVEVLRILHKNETAWYYQEAKS